MNLHWGRLNAVALSLLLPQLAEAQLLNQQTIEDVCKVAPTTSRKTLVYVDLTSLKPSETEWGLTILNKLELSPREPLTILGVNSDTFEIMDLYSSCYPAFSATELNEARASRGTVDKLLKMDPESQQRENLQIYETRLRAALNRLVDVAAKTPKGKRKNVLGAISVDKNRFQDPKSYYRVILYADGVLIDPSLSDDKVMQSISEKYPANFSGGEVYVYGVRAVDREKPIEVRERIFSAFFLSSGAFMRSFSPSLPQQSAESVNSIRSLKGTFEGGGNSGNAVVSFATLKDGRIPSGWVTFFAGSNTVKVPFQGALNCAEECKLTGAVSESIPLWLPVPYFRKDDQMALSGKSQVELAGTIQPQGKEVFSNKADAQYKIRLKWD